MAENISDRDDSNFIIIANKTYDLTNLSKEEVHRLQHLKMEKEHQGHELMHLEMFLIIVIGVAVSQSLIFYWKFKHYKSYQLCTLIALMGVPPILAIYSEGFHFLSCCAIFTVINIYVVHICTRSTISPNIPRRVYRWFLLVHNVTYFLSVAGYLLLFCMFMTLATETLIEFSLRMLLYGIYFGVVSRDFAEFCSDKMATKIGVRFSSSFHFLQYYSPEGITFRTLPPNTCSVCTLPLKENGTKEDELFTLNCSHSFHEKCIRGWCIIGKKDICPYCKEKVDLKHTFTNPWQKPHILYGNYLDLIRYMIAWQPIVLFTLAQFNRAIGLS